MEININELNVLREAYREARKNFKEEFEFAGEMMLTSYAGYLIQYCQNELKEKK